MPKQVAHKLSSPVSRPNKSGHKMGIAFQDAKRSTGKERARLSLGHLLGLAGELENILLLETEQVENIDQALSVNTGWSLELDLGLGAPGDTKASLVKHEKIIGTITDSQCLGDGNVVLSSDRFKKSALLGRIDDRLRLDQSAG